MIRKFNIPASLSPWATGIKQIVLEARDKVFGEWQGHWPLEIQLMTSAGRGFLASGRATNYSSTIYSFLPGVTPKHRQGLYGRVFLRINPAWTAWPYTWNHTAKYGAFTYQINSWQEALYGVAIHEFRHQYQYSHPKEELDPHVLENIKKFAPIRSTYHSILLKSVSAMTIRDMRERGLSEVDAMVVELMAMQEKYGRETYEMKQRERPAIPSWKAWRTVGAWKFNNEQKKHLSERLLFHFTDVPVRFRYGWTREPDGTTPLILQAKCAQIYNGQPVFRMVEDYVRSVVEAPEFPRDPADQTT